MSCIEHWTRYLHERKFRMTPQRLAILQALHAGGHLSPSQIYARVRETGMTEATVYRTLNFLAEHGVVYPSHQEGGHLTYELSPAEHHHLVCRVCGREVTIEHARLRSLLDELEAETGFRAIGPHLTFFGICPLCAARPKSPADGAD